MAHFIDLVDGGNDDLARRHIDVIEDRIISLIDSMMAEAVRGVHSFGGVDIGLMAAKVAVLLARDRVWSSLIDFFADPAVYAREKERALDWLAKRRDKVPQSIVAAMRERITIPTTLLGSKDPFESGNRSALLRFLIQFDLIGSDDAVALLLELSGDDNHGNRVDAALTTPTFVRFMDADRVALGVLLQLLEDKSVLVRTAATRQISTFIGRSERNLNDLVMRRIEERLSTSGLSEPLATIRGLLDIEPRTRRPIVARLSGRLSQIADSSPAYLLREVAGRALEE
jgi:hypothetical protein